MRGGFFRYQSVTLTVCCLALFLTRANASCSRSCINEECKSLYAENKDHSEACGVNCCRDAMRKQLHQTGSEKLSSASVVPSVLTTDLLARNRVLNRTSVRHRHERSPHEVQTVKGQPASGSSNGSFLAILGEQKGGTTAFGSQLFGQCGVASLLSEGCPTLQGVWKHGSPRCPACPSNPAACGQYFVCHNPSIMDDHGELPLILGIPAARTTYALFLREPTSRAWSAYNMFRSWAMGPPLVRRSKTSSFMSIVQGDIAKVLSKGLRKCNFKEDIVCPGYLDFHLGQLLLRILRDAPQASLYAVISERSRAQPLRVYNALARVAGLPQEEAIDENRFTRSSAKTEHVPPNASELLREHYWPHLQGLYRDFLGSPVPEWEDSGEHEGPLLLSISVRPASKLGFAYHDPITGHQRHQQAVDKPQAPAPKRPAMLIRNSKPATKIAPKAARPLATNANGTRAR